MSKIISDIVHDADVCHRSKPVQHWCGGANVSKYNPPHYRVDLLQNKKPSILIGQKIWAYSGIHKAWFDSTVMATPFNAQERVQVRSYSYARFDRPIHDQHDAAREVFLSNLYSISRPDGKAHPTLQGVILES